MWENIVVILLIILFSYLFRQTGTNIGANNKKINTFDTQMLFILLSLGALIFYKMTFIKKMEKDKEKQTLRNTENFDVQQLLKGFEVTPNTQNEDEIQEEPIDYDLIKQELFNLRGMINNMKVENTQNLTTEGSETDPESLIAYQNLQLTNLEKIVNDIKNNKLDAEEKNINKTFKKIPVYNSCYVINADNSVSGATNTQDITTNTENPSLDTDENNDKEVVNNDQQQSNIINQSTGNVGSMSLKESNIKNMTERLEKLENFFETLMNKFTNIKLLV